MGVYQWDYWIITQVWRRSWRIEEVGLKSVRRRLQAYLAKKIFNFFERRRRKICFFFLGFLDCEEIWFWWMGGRWKETVKKKKSLMLLVSPSHNYIWASWEQTKKKNLGSLKKFCFFFLSYKKWDCLLLGLILNLMKVNHFLQNLFSFLLCLY